MTTIQKLLKLIILSEIIVFSYFLFCKEEGVKKFIYLNKEKSKLQKEIIKLKSQISQQKENFKLNKNRKFYKEKIAREILTMGYKDEVWYYLE